MYFFHHVERVSMKCHLEKKDPLNLVIRARDTTSILREVESLNPLEEAGMDLTARTFDMVGGLFRTFLDQNMLYLVIIFTIIDLVARILAHYPLPCLALSFHWSILRSSAFSACGDVESLSRIWKMGPDGF
jgi:hypothetical protein